MPSNVIQNGTDADLCTLKGLNVGPFVSFSYTAAVANVASPRPAVNCGWQWLNPYPAGEDYSDVAFGAGYFAMTGKRGMILVSTNGAWPWYTVETGTKADLTAVTWAGSRFAAVAPGVMETPMTETSRNDPARRAYLMQRIPLKRFGQPAELVGPVAFLASPLASYVTGAILSVDGGFKM